MHVISGYIVWLKEILCGLIVIFCTSTLLIGHLAYIVWLNCHFLYFDTVDWAPGL